jgi:hypothetical protein
MMILKGFPVVFYITQKDGEREQDSGKTEREFARGERKIAPAKKRSLENKHVM